MGDVLRLDYEKKSIVAKAASYKERANGGAGFNGGFRLPLRCRRQL